MLFGRKICKSNIFNIAKLNYVKLRCCLDKRRKYEPIPHLMAGILLLQPFSEEWHENKQIDS